MIDFRAAPDLRAKLSQVEPGDWLELFIVLNLAFLGLDIFVAHSANEFASRAEWIPFGFSVSAPLLLLPGLLRRRLRPKLRWLALAVGAASIVVGVAGMVFHLQSSFFVQQTLRQLVYTAPFVAPLSYAGIGLLLLLNRMEAPGSVAWSSWVVCLALAGFMGNFLLSVLDHAQNGFFHASEWVAVAAGAFGVSFLGAVLWRPHDILLRRAAFAVLAVDAVIGVVGAALHASADLGPEHSGELWPRLVYGAPVFAPLLYPNLALLALLGLLSVRRTELSR